MAVKSRTLCLLSQSFFLALNEMVEIGSEGEINQPFLHPKIYLATEWLAPSWLQAAGKKKKKKQPGLHLHWLSYTGAEDQWARVAHGV